MGLTGRMGEVGVVDQALVFWGLGQVGVAIKGPTGSPRRCARLPSFASEVRLVSEDQVIGRLYSYSTRHTVLKAEIRPS